MDMVDFSKIEKKWQKKWEKEKVFAADDKGKDKYYVLEMFSYPSSAGLHVGHASNYTIGDVYARYKRMKGHEVLHPAGFDSFGLPAENAAIKAKSHPKKFTESAIKNFIKQLKMLGISYDWDRLIETHKPDYYTWDQWIFLKMYEKGLAYKKKSGVNWCSKCNTVLANEQVENGKCWRHPDTSVEIKKLDQWYFKITKYADELYEGLNELKDWPELIKTLQRNWIGKSHGTSVQFRVENTEDSIEVFTTRPDTIYGVTFITCSLDHPKVEEFVKGTKHEKEYNEMLSKSGVSEKLDFDKDKEGFFTGKYVFHPLTNERIPVYAGNFVVSEYGTGAVMGVPAHDQRDFDFAKKYGLQIRKVVDDGKEGDLDKAYLGNGKLVNSGEFNGLDNEVAVDQINVELARRRFGGPSVQFKLRDWLISRQRFWGTPIPIIYCDKCGIVPVPYKSLPVKLPEKIKFSGTENALAKSNEFINVKCPQCKSSARRETDTMDTFTNSSWYYLRYCDPNNSEKAFDSRKVNDWCPINLYIGGKEHACLHLIYFRFYCKFFRDLGMLNFDEPSKKLFNQGFIYGSDGNKMSKSLGNVVNPSDVIEKYSADALRFTLMSSSLPDKDSVWNEKSLESNMKFLLRFYNFKEQIKFGNSDNLIKHKVNKTIKEATEEIENMRYNLAIIKIRSLFESLREISKEDFESMVKLMSPFVPHLSEEIWSKLGNKGFIAKESWPEYDEKKINYAFDEVERKNDKLVGDILNIINILKERSGKDAERVYLYVLPNELPNFEANELKRRVGKEVIVYAVNDKDKYDPENKAGKVKPGRPGIYLE